MLKQLNKPLKFGVVLMITIILTLGFSISLQSLLAAWTGPTNTPPISNVDDFNIGASIGVGTNIVVSGKVGIGTTTNAFAKTIIQATSSQEGLRIVSSDNYSPLNIQNNNGINIFQVDQNGILATGTIPWARLSDAPIGTLTNGKWCTVNSSGKIECTNDAPTSGTAGGSAPINTIVAFNQATCPTGWILADGTSGTPDLRGRFVLGASATHAAGTTGGEETHVLTIAEIPSHSHTYTTRSSVWSPAGLVAGGSLTVNYGTASPSSGAVGGGGAHNNMPPYYSLIYCMKNTEGDTSSVWAKNGNDAYYNTGKVGIGASSPNSQLHIYSTSPNAEIDLQSVAGAGNHWAMYNDSGNNSLKFWNNSIVGEKNALTVLSNGNVGIGTTTPTNKLVVNGKIKMTTQTVVGDAADIVATKGYVDASASALGSGAVTGGCMYGSKWGTATNCALGAGITCSAGNTPRIITYCYASGCVWNSLGTYAHGFCIKD